MKKIILSLDDGYEEDYLTVFPYLKSKGIKATSFLITKDIGKKEHLDWSQIREMAKYGWDFQCHTNYHMKLNDMTNAEIEWDLRLFRNEFMQHSLPIPEYFAYPYGVYDERVINLIKKHFKGARGGNNVKPDKYNLPSYGMYTRNNLKELAEEKGVLSIHTHDVNDNHRGFGIGVQEFKDLIEYFLDSGFKFVTIKDYFEK